MNPRRLFLLAVLLASTACGGDTTVRFCTGGLSCGTLSSGNNSPQADAGADQVATAGELVRLDGSASTDPDGRIESYSWVQSGGTPVALVNADRAIATFTAPDTTTVEELGFQLTVVDDDGKSDADDTSVTVQPAGASASSIGFTLLEKQVYPASVDAEAACPETRPQERERGAFVGLWLAVRIIDVAGRDDPAATSDLLDALRRLMADLDPLTSSDLDGVLLGFGIDRALGFAASRDPALAAQLAEMQRELPSGGQIWDDLADGAIRVGRGGNGEPELDTPVDAATVQQAQIWLRQLQCEQGINAIELAGRTLMLACRASPDGC